MLRKTLTAVAAVLIIALMVGVNAALADAPEDVETGDWYTMEKDDREFSWGLLCLDKCIVEHDDSRPGLVHMVMRRQDVIAMLWFFDYFGWEISHSRPYDIR